MTQRSLMSRGWFVVAVVLLLLLLLLLGAYKMGFFASLMPAPADKASATLVKPGVQVGSLQSKSVPLISVPPVPGEASAPLSVAGYAPRVPVVAAAAPAPPAAVLANALVLTVRQDSWIELRSNGAAPLISRTVKAGSVETFDITRPAQLVVGNASGVAATLRGAPLMLTPASNGTTSRMTIE
jgi:cytoskeleton protein RodZ